MVEAYNISNRNSLTNKNVVFDIDETLVHTYDNYDKIFKLKIYTDAKNMKLRNRVFKLSMDDMFEKAGTGTETKMWGIMRPHLKEFLVFCTTYFNNVCVWSAGQKPYVEAVVNDIFRDIKQPTATFCWDHCEVDEDSGDFQKPLRKMYKEIPEMNETNTYIVDDRGSNFAYCNKDNGIKIPEFRPPETLNGLNTNDVALQQLMLWLNNPDVKNATDVRTLDKRNIFKTPIDTYIQQ